MSWLGFLEVLLTFALIFLLGFAIRRGSICAVAATKLWIVDRRTARIRAFIVAGACAGAVILPLSWLDPQRFILALAYPVTLQAIVAGALFGLFARMNDACAFGTLAHLTGGSLGYAFSVVGMLAGGVVGGRIWIDIPVGKSSPVAEPELASFLALSLCAVLALPALKARHIDNLRAALIGGKALLRPMTGMLVIGVGGGILYVSSGDWTYLALLRREAFPSTGSDGTRLTSLLGVVAIIAGGVFAAFRSGRFKLTLPNWRQATRCSLGGFGMGAAAAAIPGGNASLLVYSVPSFAPHAIAAYGAMTLALAFSFVPSALRRRHSRQ